METGPRNPYAALTPGISWTQNVSYPNRWEAQVNEPRPQGEPGVEGPQYHTTGTATYDAPEGWRPGGGTFSRTSPEAEARIADYTQYLTKENAAWQMQKRAEEAKQRADLQASTEQQGKTDRLEWLRSNLNRFVEAKQMTPKDAMGMLNSYLMNTERVDATGTRAATPRVPLGADSGQIWAMTQKKMAETGLPEYEARLMVEDEYREMLGGRAGARVSGTLTPELIAAKTVEAFSKARGGAQGTAAGQLDPAPGQPGVSNVEATAFNRQRGATRAETAQQTVQDSIKAGLNVVRMLDELEKDPNLNAFSYSGRRGYEEGRDVLSGLTLGAISQNPDYISFRQRLRQVSLTAFDFGGKQLTQTEKAFVLANVPSGEERTPQELRAKIADFRARVDFLTRTQARLAALPRGEYESVIAQELSRYGWEVMD